MRRSLIAALLGCAVFTGVALADDFGEVYGDYQPDGQITPCRFNKQQLQNARQTAQQDPYGTYAAFIAEVDQEIARWDAGGCAGVAPPPGSTDPAADFSAVFADWRADSTITPCRFSRQQLQNALDEAARLADIDAYAPGFRDAVRAEIRRIDRGKCGGVAGALAVGALKITKIKARAKRRTREFVTIRNASRSAIRLKGVTLRDKAGNRVRLPRGFTLKRKRKLRVVTGCLGANRKPVRRRAKFFACKRRQVWNDKGDVVKIADGGGRIIAQRGYKRFKAVPRF